MTSNSTYVDIQDMSRPPNASAQTQLLLSVMLEQPRLWRHGYELAKETGLKSGTLYPLLIRLSDQGFAEARWKPSDQPGKPPRHQYRLTGDGLALARQQHLQAQGQQPLSRRVRKWA